MMMEMLAKSRTRPETLCSHNWMTFVFIHSPATSQFSNLSAEGKREELSFCDLLLGRRISCYIIGHKSEFKHHINYPQHFVTYWSH